MTLRRQAEELFFEGTRLIQTGNHASEAELCFQHALALSPGFAEAITNLGWLRSQAGDVVLAETYYRRAITSNPTLVRAYLLLGVVLMDQRRFDESEFIYRQAIQAVPSEPDAWSNLGVLLACLQRETEAEQCYRQALALDSTHAMASFNYSYILLRQERWEQGWLHLEDRWNYASLVAYFRCPRWRGESLEAKTVVVGFEAGHGDMIFYCRYIRLLKSRGAIHVSVVCHPGLVALFATLSGCDQVFSFHDMIPASGWDYWVPPMSLPYLCGTRADSIPTGIPYIAADPARVAYWADRLPATDGCLRVGLVWKGNPDFENDADRSLASLALLAPLGAVAGVQLISLQKGRGEDEALSPPPGLSLLALGGELCDFADTAALAAHLDLVISVDTAVAHLAGAMGTPCWMLIPDYRADWRWHATRSDSLWYPGTRLFRRPRAQAWDVVIADMVRELSKLSAAVTRVRK